MKVRGGIVGVKAQKLANQGSLLTLQPGASAHIILPLNGGAQVAWW